MATRVPGPRRRRGVAVVLALLVGLALAGTTLVSSAASTAPAAQARTWVVDAVDDARGNYWESADTGTSTVTITAGDTVEWQFDRATMGHDLTSLDDADDWDPAIAQYFSPGADPFSYTFDEPGTYRYVCTIHGATMTGTVVVEEADEPGDNRPPTGTPYVQPRTGPAPLYVHFEARVSDPDGDDLEYLWDFGTADDASDTSTESHAHFSYAERGRYTASLLVTDGRGGELRRTWEIHVTGENPIARIDGVLPGTTGPAPLSVTFLGSGQDDQSSTTLDWDFGDGESGQGSRIAHTYAEPGTYTATLTATDADGNTGTDTVEIEATGDGGSEGDLPTIAASAAPASGQAPLDVALTTTVDTAGAFEPFAQGATTYPEAAGEATMRRTRGGTTTMVSLTGLKPDAAHMVHVHEEACASNNAGAHFRFDETEPFSEENEIWPLFTTDADGASGETVVESDQRAGEKAVSIVVHDPDNPAQRIACADLTPNLAGLTYTWDLGDGSTAEGADVEHTYTDAGTYEATVTVADGAGNTTTDTVEVVVDEAEEPGDTTAPSVKAVKPTGSVTSRRPTVVARIADAGAGVRKRDVVLRLDGRKKAFDWKPNARGTAWRVSFTPSSKQAYGAHTVRVVATDKAGNRTVQSWTFRIRR